MIDRCHAYAIRTKYSYKCVNCGYTIGQCHTVSLNQSTVASVNWGNSIGQCNTPLKIQCMLSLVHQLLQDATARAWTLLGKCVGTATAGGTFCKSPESLSLPSRFELVVNGKQVSAKAANSATPKAPNPFAVFVKENYKNHKAPGVKHGDVMKILSAKFSETKISK